MTDEQDFVALPQFVRDIAVIPRRSSDEHVDDSDPFIGLLEPFSGVLGFGVTTGGWPSATLSHLVLDDVVAMTHDIETTAKRDHERPAETESPTHDTDDETELRVRDLVRRESERTTVERRESERTIADSVTPPADEDGSGVGLSFSAVNNRPSIRTVTASTIRTATTVRESDRTIGSASPNPTPVLTPVDRTARLRHRRADAPDRTDAPDGWVGAEPRTNASTDDRSRVTTTVDAASSAATESIRRRGRSPTSRSRPDSKADDEVRRGVSTEEPGSGDLDAPASEPRLVSRQTPSETTTPDGVSNERRANRSTESPPLTVRRASSGADRTDETDSNAGASAGLDSSAQPPATGTDERGRSQRIDDLVDVERLADRLSRVFDRKARIERERRGR